MKRVKKFFWRFFPLVVCCCIIFSFSNYASAASYNVIDYRDYVIREQTGKDSNGETIIDYTVVFPSSLNFSQWNTWANNGSAKILNNFNGLKSFTLEYNNFNRISDFEDYDSALVVRPLGYSVLDLSLIPTGSVFYFKTNVIFTDFVPWSHVQFGLTYQFYDKDFNAISNKTVSFLDVYPEDYETNAIGVNMEGNLDKPVGAAYLMPRLVYGIFIERNYSKEFFDQWATFVTLEDVNVLIQVEKSLIDAAQDQITNDLLGDMVNGTPQQNQQVGAAVDGLENSADKMEDLAEDMKVEKPDLSGVDVSPDAIVSVADRALLTAPLIKLWEDPTILGMITTVFILVLVSWVFFGKKG